MTKILKLMFSEKSEISSMRVMSMMSLLLGGGIACYGISHGMDLSALSILCSVFVGASFGGKVSQKFIETKNILTQPPEQQ